MKTGTIDQVGLRRGTIVMPTKLSATLTLTVTDSAVPTTDSLPDAPLGVAYSFQLQAAFGKPPYSWTVTGLPPGMACSPDGLITGAPMEMGTFQVTIEPRSSTE